MLTSVCPIGKTVELINVLNDVIENFRQKHRKLRKANRSYRESITSISHDIRTPLTSVKGYVQMQKNADIPQEKKEEYLRIVERRLVELGDILNQLFMFIQADKHAVSRILENLIKNALVHGEGEYRFSLTSSEGYAVITIANETQRIEEKDLTQIFERFYTTDQSRNRRTTGLGLAIAKEFTEQMGGSIEAFLRQGYFIVEVRFRLELGF